MWTNGKRGKDELDDETLNRFSGELLRAFEAGEAEISTAASSPFLYRRIRVRIEAEERRRGQQRGAWLSLLAGVKHAIPALLAFAVVAVASLMLTPSLSISSRSHLSSVRMVSLSVPGGAQLTSWSPISN